jgi:hypothetical protein
MRKVGGQDSEEAGQEEMCQDGGSVRTSKSGAGSLTQQQTFPSMHKALGLTLSTLSNQIKKQQKN